MTDRAVYSGKSAVRGIPLVSSKESTIIRVDTCLEGGERDDQV